MMYKNLIESLQDSPYVRNWVKNIIPKLDDMDVVDVLNDLETLQGLFQEKMRNISGINK